MKDCDDNSGATAMLHLPSLPSNKIIQFLHHCLPSNKYSGKCKFLTYWKKCNLTVLPT